VTTLDYITDFCAQKHAQKVTVYYPRTQSVPKSKTRKDILFKRILSQDKVIMFDNTLTNTEYLSFSATYSTFVYLILLYYILYILIQNTRL